eukprot:COSAG05_NODE_447_length_9770_cov_3.824217_4_plen_285_part_00
MADKDSQLLGSPAVELVQPQSAAWQERSPFPVILTCEHASNALPPGYTWSADDQLLVEDHWAFDPGARGLCLELQERLQCPAILSRFSRLFCDINRAELKVTGGVESFGSTPFLTVAEDRPVQLNSRLDEAEMERRLAGAWRPYHRSLHSLVVGSPENTLLFSIHTFTRMFNPGSGAPIIPRTVEVGILCCPATDLRAGCPARLLLDHLQVNGVDARVNDPYGGPDGPGGAVGSAGSVGAVRPTLMIEVRNDLVDEPAFRHKLMAALLHCLGGSAVPEATRANL